MLVVVTNKRCTLSLDTRGLKRGTRWIREGRKEFDLRFIGIFLFFVFFSFDAVSNIKQREGYP